MPIEHDTATSRLPIEYGSESVASMRVATCAALCSSASASSSIRNSSPPTRAIVSFERDRRRNRSPTWRSTASPLLWPNESLIGLKPSRSMNSTARRAFAWSARPTAASSLSSNTSRFGRPVSASW